MATIFNKGNVVLELNWNATDPSIDGSECDGNTATCWDLSTNDDLQVDDDNLVSETTETQLNAANIPENPTGVLFQPTGGLNICNVITCDSGIGETLDTYFHIKPPLGLSPGSYETEFTVTANPI